jgi:hypothetical protein
LRSNFLCSIADFGRPRIGKKNKKKILPVDGAICLEVVYIDVKAWY